MTERSPGWLGTKEAAERLGITPRTLYRLVDEGELPMYRLGRVFRLREADVEAYLESTRVQPGSLSHLYPRNETETSEVSGT